MDPTINLPPPPEPVPHDWPWFRSKFTTWWNHLETKMKWGVPIFVGVVGVMLSSNIWRFSWGTIYYCYEYITAAFGHDMLPESCTMIMKEPHPWWDLSNDEYYKWNRCFGNHHGFQRQGELPSFGEAIAWLLNPFGFPSWLMIPAIFFFLYRVYPWMWRNLCYLGVYLWGCLYDFWTNHSWIGYIIPIPVIWAVLNARLTLFYAVIMIVGAIYLNKNTIEPFFIALVQQNTLKRTSFGSCQHVDPCQCFVELETTNAQLVQQINALSTEFDVQQLRLQDTESKLDNAVLERDGARYFPLHHSDGLNPTVIPTYGPPYDRLKPELDHAYHKVKILEQEKDNLIQEMKTLASQCNDRINKLQAQINYSRGAGENMGVAQTELDDLKSKIRTLERDNANLIVAAMETRQALAKEREMRSEKCHDEAGCQFKIGELEYKCKILMETHAQNDKMVIGAAMRFGVPKEEAQHITLQSYVRAVTSELARFRAMGVRGATNTDDIQFSQLKAENEYLEKLKNRLEREVDRLGGDLVAIRAGQDTTRPRDWRIDENYTYEQDAYRIFPIYERLCDTVGTLSKVLTVAGVTLPQWKAEKPRNDQTHESEPGWELTLEQAMNSNKLTNPRAENSDVLTHKLTINEAQRWYNRGHQLSLEIRKRAEERERALPGTVDPTVVTVLDNANKVFREVLHEVLNDLRILIQSPTEQSPDPRREKQFEIYTAMQQSIQALTNCHLMNERVPPRWEPPIHDELIRSSPDNLALMLVKIEMANLAARISQLLRSMDHYKFPGTKYGPTLTHLQNDPGYVQRFYELVTVKTYAYLTLSHYNLHVEQQPVQVLDEHGNIKTEWQPQAILLPLQITKFIQHALNRSETPEEKKRRELREALEGVWPEDVVSVMVNDPIRGPVVEFKVVDPNANDHNSNTSNNNNSSNNNNKQLTFKDNDYDEEKKKWEVNRERINQLKNHINAWGIRGNLSLPNVDAKLRANQDIEKIRRANERFEADINMLTSHIGQFKKLVPKTVRKGGKMFP